MERAGVLAAKMVAANLANAGELAVAGGTLLLGWRGQQSLDWPGDDRHGRAALVVSQGLPANAGVTIQLAGGTFDNNGHALANSGQIGGWGTLRAGSFSNSATIAFSGGATAVQGGLTNHTVRGWTSGTAPPCSRAPWSTTARWRSPHPRSRSVAAS